MPNDMDEKARKRQKADLRVGQGFSDVRGEFEQESTIPKGNGLNVNNDPAHQREKEEIRKVERSAKK